MPLHHGSPSNRRARRACASGRSWKALQATIDSTRREQARDAKELHLSTKPSPKARTPGTSSGEFAGSSARWFEADFLPAYAPDLHPVKAVWSCAKHVILANYAPIDLWELGDAAGASFVRQFRDRRLRESYFKSGELSLD